VCKIYIKIFVKIQFCKCVARRRCRLYIIRLFTYIVYIIYLLCLLTIIYQSAIACAIRRYIIMFEIKLTIELLLPLCVYIYINIMNSHLIQIHIFTLDLCGYVWLVLWFCLARFVVLSG
jgi:hypothetical protein